MKVTVEMDCTPAEARQFLGLPDVAPLQAALMQAMETKILDSAERYSPESLVKTWLSAMTPDPQRAQELFLKMFSGGFGSPKES